MKDYVIYTAIVGNYDTVLQPLAIDGHFDYILFSNDIAESDVGVWQIRSIPYANDDKTKIARWVKTHPELLLPEYNASIWIDANIQVNSPNLYQRFYDLYSDSDIIVSAVPHPQFDSVYDELFHLLMNHYEHESIIIDWGHKIHKDLYPKGQTVIETGLLYRRHKSKPVATFDTIWWESIEKYSKRDQLSVGYALWRAMITNTPFFTDGTNVRNNESVNYYDHKQTPEKYIVWGKNEAWLCRYVERNPEKETLISNLYLRIYSSRYPHAKARLMGVYYRFLDIWHRFICH